MTTIAEARTNVSKCEAWQNFILYCIQENKQLWEELYIHKGRDIPGTPFIEFETTSDQFTFFLRFG